MDKSGVTFSKNVDSELTNSLKGVLGINRSLDRELYLGLPMAFAQINIMNFGT